MIELRYYRRKLTDDEIRAWRLDHMDIVNPGPPPTHAPAVLQFKQSPQSEIELHGQIWSPWQDVPIVKQRD